MDIFKLELCVQNVVRLGLNYLFVVIKKKSGKKKTAHSIVGKESFGFSHSRLTTPSS